MQQATLPVLGAYLGARVHSEAQLGLLAVVHGQALQEQGAQAGACATTNSVEHQEALQASAVVCQLADAVQGQVNNFLADCKLQGEVQQRKQTNSMRTLSKL